MARRTSHSTSNAAGSAARASLAEPAAEPAPPFPAVAAMGRWFGAVAAVVVVTRSCAAGTSSSPLRVDAKRVAVAGRPPLAGRRPPVDPAAGGNAPAMGEVGGEAGGKVTQSGAGA